MIKASFFFSALILFSFNVYSKLVDKVAGVINDKVYTLSEIKRIQNTLSVRKEIAPFIYLNERLSSSDILDLLHNSFIIKDKLSELGFVIGDDTVEARISETQKQLQLTRPQLLSFLKSKGITMNEYFELIRSAMEYKVFQQRIISPLITITDQEVKNRFYKLSTNKNALSFKYNVTDYILSRSSVSKSDFKRLPKIFQDYRKTGNIPAIYSNFSINDLGEVSDEDLPKELSSLLKKTDENSFSSVYVKGRTLHLFFITKKELAESQEYISVKPRLYSMILQERSQKVARNWLSREALQYHIVKRI